jgi:mono/diheme cytochrome c family protein
MQKRPLLRFRLACLAAFSMIVMAAPSGNALPGSPEGEQKGTLLERGKYLVNFGGCNDCHSPKVMTPEIFIAAMRTGKHMGTGQPIKPPMPWFGLKGLTDEDLRAIFTYLRSLPPVKNPVPASVVLNEIGKK